MPDQAGYGQSLFDDKAPRAMASAIGSVTSSLGQLASGFTSLGSVSDSILSKIEQHLDTIKQKFSSLRGGGMSLGGGGGGGAGPQVGQGQPSTPSSTALVPLGPQWSGRAAPPDSQTGYAPALAGMPQGTATTMATFQSMQPTPPAVIRSFTPMAAYGAGGFGGGTGGGGGGYGGPPLALPPGGGGMPGAPPGAPPTPGSAAPPSGGGFPTMSLGSAAAESFPAAAGGVLNQLFSPSGFMAGAMQSSAYGTLASAFGYGNATDLTRRPLANGNLFYQASPQDAVGAAAMAMNQANLVPGTASWGNTFAGASSMQMLVPGLTGTQATQASLEFLMPQTMNRAIMQGMNFKPSGTAQGAASDAQQIIQRIFAGRGGSVPPSQQTTAEAFQPGNQGAAELQFLGLDPNGPDAQYIAAVAKFQAGYAAKGQTAPALGSPEAQKALTGPYQQYQKAQTAATKTLQDVIPAFADATSILNQAATKFLSFANTVLKPIGTVVDLLTKFLGGGLLSSLFGGHGGGVGGFLKGALGGVGNFVGLGSKIGNAIFGGGGGGGGGGSGSTGSSSASNAGAASSTAAITSQTSPSAASITGSSPGSGIGPTDLTAYFPAKATSGASGGSGGGSGGGSAAMSPEDLPTTGGGTPAQNQALGKTMAAAYGWTGSQFSDLVKLWNQESGWSTTATNPSSGAYGIPQSLPADKMATAGKDWKTNPATQMKWGLEYIKGRYKNPSAAWVHETQLGWYEQGSMLVDRTQMALLHKGERVIPSAQNYSATGRYQRLNSDGGTGGPTVHLNFNSGSIVLQVPAGATAADMDRVANQFVSALNNPAVLAGVRSS